MGYTYSESQGPVMCFNAVKNWKFGWYSERHVIVENGYSWTGNIYGLCNYLESSNGDAVVVRINNVPSNERYGIYISYNRKEGINSGTIEGGNQVLVHTSLGGDSNSRLVAKLDIGNSITVDGNIISFNGTGSNGAATYAMVEIGDGSAPTTPIPDTVSKAICKDDPSWYFGNRSHRDCSWFGKKARKRCKRFSGGYIHCPVTCGSCNKTAKKLCGEQKNKYQCKRVGCCKWRNFYSTCASSVGKETCHKNNDF